MISIEHYYNTGELFDNRYKLLRPLSTDGATADVWLATDMNTIDMPSEFDEADVVYVNGQRIGGADSGEGETGMQVAIKIYRPKNALDIEGEQRFRDEFKIVYNCHHANLLQPSHFSIFQDTPYLVLPFCRDGSAQKLVEETPDEKTLWKFLHDVASGLAYLHACQPPIIHQDIKPGNVLIDSHGNFAITDFGISSKFGGFQHSYDDGNAGTMAYMAPERFEEGYEPEAPGDIWALGATLYEIVTRQVPFGEDGGLAQASSPTPLPPVSGVSPEMVKLIHSCLAKDPAARPTAQQLADTAHDKLFPRKSHKGLFISLAVLGMAIAAAASFFVGSSGKVELPPQIPVDTLYAKALAQMNSDNADTLKAGLHTMDSLSGAKYIPAIYQMAFTYGWYSDSLSVKRKRLLGINIDELYMPRGDRHSNKAVALFTRIMELNDSAYADINANATYRLACYYVMPNNIYQPNYNKGKLFLMRSRDWALMAGDTALLRRIDNGLATFPDSSQTTKLTNSQTHKLTNSQTRKLTNSQTHKLTNSRRSRRTDIQCPLQRQGAHEHMLRHFAYTRPGTGHQHGSHIACHRHHRGHPRTSRETGGEHPVYGSGAFQPCTGDRTGSNRLPHHRQPP